jgi:23S rRNA (cytidine1920-2'-O)/16S rRNA (cytidine1409-2'-O)-methyltransferase
MIKQRLDILLVENGLTESRSLAQRLIMAGQVRVNGEVVIKSGIKFPSDVKLEIIQIPRFVSRGGEKLVAAFEAFPLSVDDYVCADVGASTGGFTDCLLQKGARRVYAIDVGKGILHWKIRQDPRVIVMEGTNARYLQSLPEPVNLVTIDASFISLKILLPVVKEWFIEKQLSTNDQIHPPTNKITNQVVALIKPQFEAGKNEATRGQGVIRDPKIHQRVLKEILSFAQQNDYTIHGVIRSPILGPKGNTEFLTWLSYESINTLKKYSFDIMRDLPI